MNGRELILELPHLRLAALEWGPADGRPVIALHGWLDNAASFAGLAPLLEGQHIVALDLPGHGRSDHRPVDANHHFVDWVPEIAGAADALGWGSFSLLGHSMGAGISSLVPATYPDRVDRVVLLEGAGPMAAPAEKAPEQLVAAIADEERLAASSPRIFPNFEKAVAARLHDSDLDTASARVLVERGTENAEGGLRFTFDPRLKTRSRVRFTENQARAFLAAIPCPVLAVRALQGWPFPLDVVMARMAVIKDLESCEVEGGHHVHLTHPERVAAIVGEFLNRS